MNKGSKTKTRYEKEDEYEPMNKAMRKAGKLPRNRRASRGRKVKRAEPCE